MPDPTQTFLSFGLFVCLILTAVLALWKHVTRVKPSSLFLPPLPVTPPSNEETTSLGAPLLESESLSPSNEDPYRYASPPLVLTPPPLTKGKVPVWFANRYDFFGVFLILLVFCGPIFSSAEVKTDIKSIEPFILIVNIFLQLFMASLFLAVVKIRTPFKYWLFPNSISAKKLLGIAVLTVVSMWGINILLNALGYNQWIKTLGVPESQDSILLLIEHPNPICIGLLAFTATIIAPLCEEIIFRGYLYTILKRFVGLTPSILISGFIFACAHNHLASLLPLFILGSILAYLYERTGSIFTPIAVHCLFNSSSVALLLICRACNIPIDPSL